MKRIAILLLSLLIALPASIAKAEEQAASATFADHCARCHGSDGKGNGFFIRALTAVSGAKRPVDFTDKAVMSNWSDKRLAAMITDGGATMGGSSLMPAYKESLSQKQIADLVSYIRSLSK
jgi:mono/diheme cytochrome c family protein